MRFIILEDNLDRRSAMQSVLKDRFPAYPIEFFAAAQPMIQRLTESGLYDIAAISLDHDLELIKNSDGRLEDPGTGVDVAEWLSRQPAVSPIVVHTTNTAGGDRMVELLQGGGWETERIVPYGGEDWINERWRSIVRDHVTALIPFGSISSLGVEVIKCGLRAAKQENWVASELLKLCRSLLHDAGDVSELTIEFVVAKENGFDPVLGSGSPALKKLEGGSVLEATEEFSQIESLGPVDLSELSFSEPVRRFLLDQRVQQIQVDVVQPQVGFQGILFVASRNAAFPLRSHRVQGILRELRSLIELAFLIELQTGKGPTRNAATNPSQVESGDVLTRN